MLTHARRSPVGETLKERARVAWPALRRAQLAAAHQRPASASLATPADALHRYYPSGVATHRAEARDAHGLRPGDELHGFHVEAVTSVPEFGGEVVCLRHLGTGARHVHVDTADTSNVFCVAFRTPPTDSTGTPHILEHTVLCGSEQFPVRDPFFAMMKRSLNSFMNALTGPIHTMYPFSTQVPADFVNLATVYADAVFHPHLRHTDFLQEGHRLQLDAEGNLELAGVVLNEMKGTLGDRDMLWATHLQRTAMPGSSFAHEFGGAPREIPDLTHDALRAFHARHYHPSNSLFFTYGDLPVRSHLAFLDERVLRGFAASPDAAAVAVQPPHPLSSGGDTHSAVCPPDPLRPDSERQSYYARAIPAPDPGIGGDPGSEHYHHLRSRFLASLLVDGPASPIYQHLIDSGLGTGYCPAAGFSSSGPPVFALGVRGMRREDEGKVDEAIEAALVEAEAEGFDPRRAEGILHQLELSLKHRTADFGLSWCSAVTGAWAMGRDIVDCVSVGSKLERLREEGRDPELLRQLLRTQLLEPRAVARASMHPDSGFEARELAFERSFLEGKAAEMGEGDREQLRLQQQELAVEQAKSATQDISCLPTLTRGDIPPRTVLDRAQEDRLSLGRAGTSVPLQVVEEEVADMVYVRLKLDMSTVPPEDWKWLHILPSFLRSLGTSSLSHDEFATAVQGCARAINFGLSCTPNPHNPMAAPELTLRASVSCLAGRLDEATDLLTGALVDTRWSSVGHATTILASAADAVSSNVANEGHGVAAAFSARSLSPTHWFSHVSAGVSALPLLTSLAAREEDGAREALDACARIMRGVLAQPEGRGGAGPDLGAWSWPAELCGAGAAATAATVAPVVPAFDVRRDGAAASVVASRDHVSVGADAARRVLESLPSRSAAVGGARPEAAAWWKVAAGEAAAETGVGAEGTSPRHTALVAPLPIKYGGWSTATGVSLAHRDGPALVVFGELLSSLFLHRRVREEGGAYGAGADHGNCTFTQWSFYDPHVTETAQCFDEALQWARRREFSERDVQEALLSVFAQVDAPRAPSATGMTHFLHGITDDMRQARREQYLAVSADRVADAVERYLPEAMEHAHTAFLVPGADAVPAGWSSHTL